MKVFRVLVTLLSIAISAHAQTFQAQVGGEVRDPSGAIIPNANLTATNVSTNVPFTTESNEQGIYRFLALPPGQYKIPPR